MADTAHSVELDVTERKGERTRVAILDAAITHFAAVGSRGASVPAIARAVGISPSAVYVYFATKAELFAAAVDADVDGLIREALPEIATGEFTGDFAGVFARLIGALDHHLLARRVLEGAEATGMERMVVLPSQVRLQRGIAAALRAGQRRGTIRSDIEPTVFAAGLEAVVLALLVAVIQTDGQIDSAHARGAIAVLEASIRPSV